MLTDFQINLIEKDIASSGVYMKELVYDLLDHVCCSVEEKMQDGEVFDKAYEQTKSEFCHTDYEEIQAETKFLLTINSNKMKKTKKTFAITAFVAFILGNIFKMAHWPGGSILILLATIITLGLLTSFFRTKFLEEPTKQVKIIRNLSIIVAICLTLGICFYMMHWPGATALFLSGLAIMTFGMTPILLKHFSSVIKQLNGTIAAVGMAFIGLTMLAFTTQDFSKSFYTSLYSTDVFITNKEDKLHQNNQQLKQNKKSLLLDNLATSHQYIIDLKKDMAPTNSDEIINTKTLVEKGVWKHFASVNNKKINSKRMTEIYQSFKDLEAEAHNQGIKDFYLVNLGQDEWVKEYFVQHKFGVFMYLDHLLLEISRLEREVLLYH